MTDTQETGKATERWKQCPVCGYAWLSATDDSCIVCEPVESHPMPQPENMGHRLN